MYIAIINSNDSLFAFVAFSKDKERAKELALSKLKNRIPCALEEWNWEACVESYKGSNVKEVSEEYALEIDKYIS